jgi:hypothetical protein
MIIFHAHFYTHSYNPTAPRQEASTENTKAAEEALLKARANYQVRCSVIEQTLIANPIVKSVHATSKASIAEQ